MKRYFYITVHFSPAYEEIFQQERNGLYRHTETGELFRRRPLYDFGWGQEQGFELFPSLPFSELTVLLEHRFAVPSKSVWRWTSEERLEWNIHRDNLYGAAAVIMQDHVEEFIKFLAGRIKTNYFDDPALCENYRCFSFDPERERSAGRIPGGVKTRSYGEILNGYSAWRTIAQQVIKKVYR